MPCFEPHAMGRVSPIWIVLTGIAVVGCSRRVTEPPRAQDLGKHDVTRAAGDAPLGGDPLAGAHGSRKLRGIDVPVYVDGVQAGVLRYGELPPIANVGTDVAPEFRLVDYLAAIGVAPDRVKAIHLHDGADRIGGVEGAELLKEPARFRVHFTSGNTGAAEARWDTVKLKNGFVVHEIRKLSVFVAKAVPPIQKGAQCHLADGKCTDQVPYAQGDAIKGTRIYLDGRLVGFVKRKLLSDAFIVGGQGDDHEYSVAKLAASLGVDIGGTKLVELVSGDEVVARADEAQWNRHNGDLDFTLPKHQHGKVRVHVPAEMQAAARSTPEDKDALVTSMHFYQRTTPPSHELVAISEATELHAQIASNDPAATQDEEPGHGR